MLTPQYYRLRGEKALVKFFQVFKVSKKKLTCAPDYKWLMCGEGDPMVDAMSRLQLMTTLTRYLCF